MVDECIRKKIVFIVINFHQLMNECARKQSSQNINITIYRNFDKNSLINEFARKNLAKILDVVTE